MGQAELKTSLIRKWAHAPWHSWLKEHRPWLDLFAELWARLPSDAVQELVASPRELIVLPPVNFGRVVRIAAPLLTGAFILQLDERLLERPRAEALAILAHELAHLCTAIDDDELQNDLRADQLAAAWGFKQGLVEALGRDLETEHPRLKTLLIA